MDYTQLTADDTREMLATLGVSSIESLFAGIPAAHRVEGLLDIPPGLSEPELLDDVRRLAGRNTSTAEQISFLGAGIYDHFIPVLVDALAMQSEFLTAYTPYQAEASQGVLQAFFEFQTLVCQLTGMEVANASLYEGASAAAEAVMMAVNVKNRDRVVVAGTVHPDTRRVLDTYTYELPITPVAVAPDGGVVTPAALASAIDDTTAAVVLQQPNFYGVLEDLPALIDVVHDAGALAIVSVDPLSCGLLRSPGSCGADIVVGEGQGLGIPQSFGGPVLGLMAARQSFLRKMPGRLVGQTLDRDGRRSYCLTLQTREQHIRREKATSNVCTNQGLLAMRAAVYLTAMGRQGVARVARQCFDNAHYAAERFTAIDGFELTFDQPFYQEFALTCRPGVERVLEAARADGILAGVPLRRWDPAHPETLLIAVTEQRRRADIDRLAAVLEAL